MTAGIPHALRTPAPQTVAETGLAPDLIDGIVQKMLHLTGAISGTDLASRLGVLFSVIQPTLDWLKRERYCELSGGAVGPQSYIYRLTEAGHSRAAAIAEHNQYVGPLPVPVQQYRQYMRTYTQDGHFRVNRSSVRKAFERLVLSERTLDQLGPAIAARHSLFIYGPPGNGKTVISQAVGNLMLGPVAVPYALSIDTEVVRVYDPLHHQRTEDLQPKAQGLSLASPDDRRWVWCRRPVVTGGGELTLDALDLAYSASTGFYRAPLQLLANGGVLIIDDFGRQRIAPRELLNRWIVPLESRVDHLMLQSGQKVELPFEVLVVFATNLNPLDLVDESFLRRLRYKVYAESPTTEEFCLIFQHCCEERGLTFDRSLVEGLIARELRPRHVALRGCQPRDLIDQALTLAQYAEQPRQLTPDLLATACAMYFINDDSVETRP